MSDTIGQAFGLDEPSDQAADLTPTPAQLTAVGSRPSIAGGIVEWLRTPAAEGKVSAYADHPLNLWPDNPAGARIARGIEGMTGGVRLAIVDLCLGLAQLWTTRRRPPGAE